MRPQATPIRHVDDDRFRATEWRFAPGAETGWHVHGHDYVIVPLTDGRLLLEEAGGAERAAALSVHAPYARRAGVAHNVVNGGDAPLAFLEVEVVDDAADRARLATMARFAAAWNARDVEALMACMAPDCAFHAFAGPEAEGARHVGPAAVRTAYAAVFDDWPVAEWRDAAHSVAGPTGVSSWRFFGTRRDGVSVEVEGCDLFRFAGERIALTNSFRKGPLGLRRRSDGGAVATTAHIPTSTPAPSRRAEAQRPRAFLGFHRGMKPYRAGQGAPASAGRKKDSWPTGRSVFFGQPMP